MQNRKGTLLVDSFRLALLPFPVAVVLGMLALMGGDYLWRVGPAPTASGPPVELLGGLILLIASAIFQLVWGIPTLLKLDRRGAGARGYLVTGALSAIVLSFGLSVLLRAPQFGETLGWMFPRALLFLGVPIVLAYLLAWFTRRQGDQAKR